MKRWCKQQSNDYRRVEQAIAFLKRTFPSAELKRSPRCQSERVSLALFTAGWASAPSGFCNS
jgi:hypothetical protein